MVSRTKTSTQPTARVLLVDDNRSGMMARRSVLEELGYIDVGVNVDVTMAVDAATLQLLASQFNTLKQAISGRV